MKLPPMEPADIALLTDTARALVEWADETTAVAHEIALVNLAELVRRYIDHPHGVPMLQLREAVGR